MDLVTSSVFSPGGSGKAWLDQILIVPQRGLLAVADAPAGGDNGRAGVKIALEAVRGHIERNEDVLQRFLRNPSAELRTRILNVVEEAFARATQEVYAYARRREGLTVTLDVVLMLHHEAFVGHVGDGRIYLVRRGLVHQLTVDHSRDHAQMFAEGSPEDTPIPAPERQFTRSLGPDPRVEVESMCMELMPEDRFIACTASLHRTVPETILHNHFASEPLQALGPALSRDAGPSPLIAAAAQLGSGEPFTPGSAQSRLAILRPMPLFTHCTNRELRAVAAATRPHTFRKDDVIFHQGAPGTEIYLVISGKIRIEKDGKAIVLLGPGSNFGEMAMLDEPVRSAAAVADEDCELMVFPREAFFGLLKGNPMLAVKILWNMSLRISANLRTTNQRLSDLTEQLKALQ